MQDLRAPLRLPSRRREMPVREERTESFGDLRMPETDMTCQACGHGAPHDPEWKVVMPFGACKECFDNAGPCFPWGFR